jgi:di/tricarboxylate transporter
VEHLLILGLIAGALILFASEAVRPDIVAIGVAVVLLLSGAVTVAEGFSGFSNPAVITVICMFILSAGLVRTGVADYMAAAVLRFGGTSPALLTVGVMLAVGTLSMFMNNIGAVAVLMPVMFAIAQRSGYPASKLLIPLSFGSLLGGLVTVIGTPPNLLVSAALEDAGYRGFRLFDFAPTGLAVMATGIAYMALLGRFLIPLREPESDLTQQYSLDAYLTEVVVPPGSPLVGRSVEQTRIRRDLGLLITRLRRQADGSTVSIVPQPDTILREGDRLIVEGRFEELVRTKEGGILALYAERKFSEADLTGPGVELAEAVVAPGSRLLDRAIKQSDIRRRYGVLVLGLRRRQRTVQDDFVSVPLEVGDVLLVQGTPKAIRELARSADFLVVQRMGHAPRERSKAGLAVGIMTAAVLAAATGLVHISVAGLTGVLLMAVTRCIAVQEMYRAVDWRVVFLIACMMPLGIAMDAEHSGTAAWLAHHILAWTGGHGPLVVMASLFLLATLITEVMSNAAAAVLLAPIAIAVAAGLGVDPHPLMMAIAIGASTTFLTPIGHQTNVLVYGVGNYRFGDFARTGALLNVLIFVVAMVTIPLVWPFHPAP